MYPYRKLLPFISSVINYFVLPPIIVSHCYYPVWLIQSIIIINLLRFSFCFNKDHQAESKALLLNMNLRACFHLERPNIQTLARAEKKIGRQLDYL